MCDNYAKLHNIFSYVMYSNKVVSTLVLFLFRYACLTCTAYSTEYLRTIIYFCRLFQVLRDILYNRPNGKTFMYVEYLIFPMLSIYKYQIFV